MTNGDSISLYRTRGSLLLRLKDQSEEQSWAEFYSIYGRLIFGYALNHKLSHSEAEDIVQEVCVKVSRQIANFNYSEKRGRFRSWLKVLTRNAVIDYIRRQESRRNTSTKYQEYSEVLADEKDAESERLWREEWEKTILDVALKRVYERVSERCRKAFELLALNRLSAAVVGKQLDMQPNTVYASKHRVMEYLREEVAILEKECEDLES